VPIYQTTWRHMAKDSNFRDKYKWIWSSTVKRTAEAPIK